MIKEQSTMLNNPFKTIIDQLWRHKFLLILVGGIILYGTYYLTSRQKKIYQASAQIIIELQAPQYMPYTGREVVSLGSGNSWNTKEFFETQFRIIRSRQVSQEVVNRLHLNLDDDFLGLTKLPKEHREQKRSKSDPAGKLMSKISLIPVSDSHVVLVQVKDHRPERAALLANTIAEVYREQNVGHKVSAALEAVRWLGIKLNELGDKRRLAESALLQFKQENGLMQSSLSERQKLIGMTMQSIEQQLVEIGQKVDILRSESSLASRTSSDEALVSLPKVISNSLIQRLKEQKLNLENQRTNLLEHYLDAHPQVRVITEQLDRLKKTIRKEVDGIKRLINSEYKSASEVQRGLNRKLKELQDTARSLQSQELRFLALEQDVTNANLLFNQLQLRHKEAELQAQTTANNVRILDAALPPKSPIFPRLSLNLAAAILGWLLLCALLLILIDFMDRTIKNIQDFELAGRMKLIGTIPTLKQGRKPNRRDPIVHTPDLYIFEAPNSSFAEAIRVIRTNLLFMDADKELRSILITSATPQDGKTMVSVQISVILATTGKRVLIVDADLRRPRLHRVFQCTNSKGFTELLLDHELAIDSVTKPTEIETLDLLTTGPLPPNPSEILQTTAFKITLRRLQKEYDYVIFDSPPVIPVTDAQIIGRQVDGAILIARVDRTRKDTLRKAADQLLQVDVPLLGGILNAIDRGGEGYGYYYYDYHRDESTNKDALDESFDELTRQNK